MTQLSSQQTIRLSFKWLMLLAVMIFALGLLGGVVGQELRRSPSPIANTPDQIVTTVQQVTVSPNTNRAGIVEASGRSMVLVTQVTGTVLRTVGAGVIVTNDGLIATPVELSGAQLGVIDQTGSSVPVSVVGRDTVYGITYLRLTSGVAVPVELTATEVPVGSELTVISRSAETSQARIGHYQLEEYVLPGAGRVAAWQRLGQGTVNLDEILSGEPLIDEEGRLAGLLLNEAGLMLRGSDLKESLDRVIANRREFDPLALLGMTVTYEFTTVSGKQQFAAVVDSVTGASPTAVAGIRSGDIMVRIGAEPIVWAKNLTMQLPTALPVSLTTSRQGVERTVTLTAPQ